MPRQRLECANVEKGMGPLVKGLVITIVLLIGGLAVTQLVASALEQRAVRPVDQAFSPTSD